MLTFGPVPSRRLGKSLGINNLPHKICSYSCIYCQLGRTMDKTIERKSYFRPEEIRREVEKKIEEFKEIDFLTFVPNGEPTLDVNLGREIKELKDFSMKIAVITNGSLLWREDVRKDLMEADWISIKIDSVDRKIWSAINRPHPSLNLEKVLDGILEFSSNFNGFLATETMLLDGINDSKFGKFVEFLEKLNPNKSYISVPIRPPAEDWVKPAREDKLNQLYQEIRERSIDVELLIHYEGRDFGISEDIKESILSIASVHPLREDYLLDLLAKAKADKHVLIELVEEGKLSEVVYRGMKFYVKRMKR
ncbi:MAG: radical SAM protein [Thermoplasmata archaeon]|nr:radical SAM protein [Thermoplasmata archaeon]